MLQHGFLSRLLACIIACAALMSVHESARAAAAKRDHLTPQEADQVRAAQILDKRIEVFIKAAERRLLAINDPNAAASKQVQKEVEKWGELPKGTRAELLTDLAKILDEAITNIDDVAARDAANHLLPKALRRLASASTRFIEQLMPMRTQAKDETEREAVEQALEYAQSIIIAANKLPPDTKEKGKSEKSKS